MKYNILQTTNDDENAFQAAVTDQVSHSHQRSVHQQPWGILDPWVMKDGGAHTNLNVVSIRYHYIFPRKQMLNSILRDDILDLRKYRAEEGTEHTYIWRYWCVFLSHTHTRALQFQGFFKGFVYYILKVIYFCNGKSGLSASLLQSSVSHDPSEIILICWLGAKSFYYHRLKQLCCLIFLWIFFQDSLLNVNLKRKAFIWNINLL